MSTKQSYDQHNLLHKYFPCDCCLCRAEVRIAKLEKELAELKAEGTRSHTIRDCEGMD